MPAQQLEPVLHSWVQYSYRPTVRRQCAFFLWAEKRQDQCKRLNVTASHGPLFSFPSFWPHHLHPPWNPRTGSFLPFQCRQVIVRRRLQRLEAPLCNDSGSRTTMCCSLEAGMHLLACLLCVEGWQALKMAYSARPSATSRRWIIVSDFVQQPRRWIIEC